MTYGIYTKDLKAVLLSKVSLETARKYRHGTDVICSEKLMNDGFKVSVKFLKWWLGFRFYRSLGMCDFGWIRVEWRRLQNVWADKIVEDGNPATES